MSRDQEQAIAPSPRPNGHLNIQNGSLGISAESDYSRQYPPRASSPSEIPYADTTGNAGRLPERQNLPTRSSTTGSVEPDRNLLSKGYSRQAHSEDLNHSNLPNSLVPGGSSPRVPYGLPSSPSSRPNTPLTSSKSNQPSSTAHSVDSNHQTSVTSNTINLSSTSNLSKSPPSANGSSSGHLPSSMCAVCGNAMEGSFVRALGAVYHLECFTCMDCGDVVASKFFPIEGPDGRQQPLCERDYFRRLNLICAKCGMALRGSYITACNKKYHVEHFTCSLCSTLFGPQDSYYEHENDVYCHFHYSTRFATKCAGCNSAILKQFVEINRNMRDECWHPECYMINKFWNVKVVARRPTSSTSLEGELDVPAYVDQEQRETPASLKEKQLLMEQQVYRIWTVLSAFEESSAACIAEMLRHVSNGQYLEAIRMAEKFILHVEVLFAAIDDLEWFYARLNLKGMSHVREARMLCRKTVELFTLLSHTQETGTRRMGMTQELLALVTGIAHYLKILIRIALTGALALERQHNIREAMTSFLDKLHLLAVQGANPSAKRLIKGPNGDPVAPHPNGNHGTQRVTYGFRSLAPENAGDSPFSSSGNRDPNMKPPPNPPSDLCVRCNQTVEEDCVRLGTYQRWHSQCLQCAVCGKVAAVPGPKDQSLTIKNGDDKDGKEGKDGPSSRVLNVRRPPANVGIFLYDMDSKKNTTSFGEVPTVVLCNDHAHANCRGGFQAVQRLEQYAFLLNVALRRLYVLLKKQGVVQDVPVSTSSNQSQTSLEHNPYRNSGDIVRMKSVHLDRKLSATARLPKRSTIVESPTGRSVHPSEVVGAQRVQESVAPQPQQSIPQIQPHYGQQGQVSQHIQNLSAPVPTPQPSTSYSSLSYSQPSTSPPQQQIQQPLQQQGVRPHPGKLPIDITPSGQVIRPNLTRNNTEVMIVDESAPNSPAGGDESQQIPSLDDGITLADLPQLMEVAQAREQQRSLPRQNSIPFVAELTPLELAIVKHSALLVLIRSPLKDQFDLDELLELVEIKKSGFWQKLFKGDKKNVKKKGVFGVALELLVERDGSDSVLGATRATLRVPSFIDDIVSAMRQMDMSIEGIFRKNGNIRHLNELAEAIDRDSTSVDLSADNPVQLAALLKRFFRELPEPLMTFKLQRLLVATQSLPQEADRRRYLHMVSLLLPKSHRDTLEVLFVFLKWVASFAHMDAETGSKMDLGNLATVIGPTILRGRSNNAMPEETFGAVRVVTEFLEHQEEYYAVPEEFIPIIHDQDYFVNSMELPAKDFLKKCDMYMRLKANSGRPPPGSPYIGTPNANSAPTPRYPPMNSPVPERPVGYQQDRNGRPPLHPGLPAASSYQRSGSPSMQQNMMQQHQQPQQYQHQHQQSTPRIPQQQLAGEWASSQTPSPNTPSSTRPPASYPQTTRPSVDHPHPNYSPNPNGYQPTVWQRT
ncbi:hypothetical protein AX16_001404 [Volvariella volvacea WC 439]|nr:hypothetical protein AX16_001404 [Volvariella volvacea WC 439]